MFSAVRCAINGHVLKEPVRSPYGQVFERATIELWLTTRGSICPITNQPLTLADLKPADDLRVRSFRELPLCLRILRRCLFRVTCGCLCVSCRPRLCGGTSRRLRTRQPGHHLARMSMICTTSEFGPAAISCLLCDTPQEAVLMAAVQRSCQSEHTIPQLSRQLSSPCLSSFISSTRVTLGFV